MTTTLQERLRTACESIRRNSMPLADLIPLLAQAADALDHPPTGLSEMGWIIEGGTAGELAAYDQGCGEMMAALERILDGKDDGAGVANPPWEPLRRRVLALVKDGPVMQRGTDGTGAPWMGTMREVLEDYKQAAEVEASLRDEVAGQRDALRTLLEQMDQFAQEVAWRRNVILYADDLVERATALRAAIQATAPK